jgi:hypothetical protein
MKLSNLIVLFFFLNMSAAFAQIATDSLSFPASWQGMWTGNLEIFNSKGLAQSLPMRLHILPIHNSDRYTWTIFYGEDTIAGKRDYELVPVDTAKGIYSIDEKNSIAMEGYLLGGKYFQRFEVMGNLLLTTTEKVSETELMWEIISGKLEPVSSTGEQEIDGEEIPEVKTYPIGVLQRARLVLSF